MAHCALTEIKVLRTVSASIFGEPAGPRDVVGVDVNDSGFRIHPGTTPFCPAIESWKDHGIFSDAEGNELSFAAKFTKFLEGPLMHLWSAIGEQLLSESLASKWRGLGWERLLRGGDFAGYITRRILSRFDRKQRSACGALKKINETLFCGLCYGVDLLLSALYSQKRGRRRKIAIPQIMMNTLKVPDSFSGISTQCK